MNFFDEMAGVWNKTCRYDTGRIEKVLSVLQLKQGDTVLDIGTGTGVMHVSRHLQNKDPT